MKIFGELIECFWVSTSGISSVLDKLSHPPMCPSIYTNPPTHPSIGVVSSRWLSNPQLHFFGSAGTNFPNLSCPYYIADDHISLYSKLYPLHLLLLTAFTALQRLLDTHP